MGETAENVAERFGVSREDQDAYALASHERAVKAQRSGTFEREIVLVEIPQRCGEPRSSPRMRAYGRTPRSSNWRA